MKRRKLKGLVRRRRAETRKWLRREAGRHTRWIEEGRFQLCAWLTATTFGAQVGVWLYGYGLRVREVVDVQQSDDGSGGA